MNLGKKSEQKSVLKRHAYTYLNDEDYEALGKAVQILGYENLSEFHTASALVLLYGDDTAQWCMKLHNRLLTHNAVIQAFNEILDKRYFAVIAVHGQEYIQTNDIYKDICSELYQITGYVPSTNEFRCLLKNYVFYRKDEILQHRKEVFCRKYGDTFDIEEREPCNDFSDKCGCHSGKGGANPCTW